MNDEQQTNESQQEEQSAIQPESDDARTFAILAHALGIITGFLGPLIIWMIKKDSSPFVDDQGKESLNFQLMLLIGWVIAGVTSFFCIGVLLMPVLMLVQIIFPILAAVAVSKGEQYRYPFNLRMIS